MFENLCSDVSRAANLPLGGFHPVGVLNGLLVTESESFEPMDNS